MKILLLIDSLLGGGKERRLLELIKGLRGYENVEVHLIIFSDRIHYKEVFEFGIPVTILKRVPKKNPMVFWRLLKLCRQFKPDIIHSWGTMSTILAIPSSLILNIKLINGNIANAPDNMSFFDKRKIRAKFTFLFSDCIVANSQAGLSVYNAPANKSKCIYNGFDTKRILKLKSKDVIRKNFSITTEKVVGMVGGFYGKKDYRTYIESALSLLKSREDITFVAVGGGIELPKYQKMIPSEYKDRFIFTDVQKDVESIINIFDIGVLSTYTEGISNAILEYMALEKPVIASIGGGTIEIVVDEKTGYLIPQSSPQELVKRINILYDNPELIKKMGRIGKKRIEDVFSLKKMTSSFYNLYEQLLINKRNK